MKLFREAGSNNSNQFPERLLYLSGEIEEASDVLPWDDQCMAGRNGVSVTESHPVLIADPDSSGFDLAKRTVHYYLRFGDPIIMELTPRRKCCEQA
jgi:hypothetical protein